MRIKLAGGAYQDRYKRFNSQRCVNWHPAMAAQSEVTDAEDKIMYLKPTPGLETFVEVTGNKVRGIFAQDQYCFFVVSNVLYQLTGDTVTTIGTMTNFSKSDGQRVYFTLNGANELGIFGGATAYYYNIDTATLAQITDIDFPGADNAEYMDGYTLVAYNGRVYFSELNDVSNWIGDGVFTPTYEADKAVRVKKLKGIVWSFGSSTIEPYYQDGTTPFTRIPQSSFDIGLASPDSVAKLPNALLFIGQSQRGSVGVYIIDTQNRLSLISPRSISDQIANPAVALKSIYAFAEETTDSHQFYHICIPDIGTTFTYDLITKEWHERQSLAPYKDARGNDIFTQWRVNCTTFFQGRYLAGDYYSGKVFDIKDNLLTEDGNRITRIRTVGTFAEEQKYVKVSRMVLDASVGITDVESPKMMLRVSMDGGNTYRNERMIDLPEKGQYGERIVAHHLGTGRNWAVELKLTDAVDLALIGMNVHGAFGAS